ncbi:hypothetical protein GQ597_04620 [Gilliamella sp. Pra-s65]|uniref:hypothetical protein n=1 Tax=unclassified Gilliamella TaxID=2685620 RepID=UPI0013654BD6|nr:MULTISPECIES: hypothetical protein [unclassified Gilliamella]MWN89992.1 hypothetical protein [Gilliamella sp. Pra-s65]MWP72881.1 hypothetical protein [Gilliamella sp. Pra-s52]
MLKWPKKYARKGDYIREQAIKEYKITPVFHGVLLPNQQKTGYFNQKITTNYYCFEFRLVNSKDKIGFFYCGDDAAKKWLTLINEAPLPLFNPLSTNYDSTTQSNRENRTNNNEGKKILHPIRKDLLVILNTLMALFDITDYSSAIPAILQRISKDKNLDLLPKDRDIKAVNTNVYKRIRIKLFF